MGGKLYTGLGKKPEGERKGGGKGPLNLNLDGVVPPSDGQGNFAVNLSRKDVEKKFVSWANKAVPKAIDGYDDDHPYVIADVFMYEYEVAGGKLLVDADGKEKLTYTFCYPLAKVWQVGRRWDGVKGLEKGNLVRMRDYDTRTLINPRYEVQVKHEYSKSNIADYQVGRSEPKYIQSLWMANYRRMFEVDPFELRMPDWQGHVFFFDNVQVMMAIPDYGVFLKTKELRP